MNIYHNLYEECSLVVVRGIEWCKLIKGNKREEEEEMEREGLCRN